MKESNKAKFTVAALIVGGTVTLCSITAMVWAAAGDAIVALFS